MRRIHPAPAVELSDDEVDAAYTFRDGPWLRGSMVATLDGTIRGASGKSGSIATDADRRLFAVLRASADAILVGAGTVRAEDYRPSAKPIVVVSGRLDLHPSQRLFTDRATQTARPIVLTTDRARATADPALLAVADVLACGGESIDLRQAMTILTGRALIHVHCEGGPRLLGDLAAAGLLDELLLTVTPRLQGGGPTEHLLNVAGGLAPQLRFATHHVLEEEGSVFISARRVEGHVNPC